MDYAALAFIISIVWTVTGFNYFKNDTEGLGPFILLVLLPGLAVFTISLVAMAYLYFR